MMDGGWLMLSVDAGWWLLGDKCMAVLMLVVVVMVVKTVSDG